MSDASFHWNRRSDIKVQDNAQGLLKVGEGCSKFLDHIVVTDNDIM